MGALCACDVAWGAGAFAVILHEKRWRAFCGVPMLNGTSACEHAVLHFTCTPICNPMCIPIPICIIMHMHGIC